MFAQAVVKLGMSASVVVIGTSCNFPSDYVTDSLLDLGQEIFPGHVPWLQKLGKCTLYPFLCLFGHVCLSTILHRDAFRHVFS